MRTQILVNYSEYGIVQQTPKCSQGRMRQIFRQSCRMFMRQIAEWSAVWRVNRFNSKNKNGNAMERKREN